MCHPKNFHACVHHPHNRPKPEAPSRSQNTADQAKHGNNPNDQDPDQAQRSQSLSQPLTPVHVPTPAQYPDSVSTGKPEPSNHALPGSHPPTHTRAHAHKNLAPQTAHNNTGGKEFEHIRTLIPTVLSLSTYDTYIPPPGMEGVIAGLFTVSPA